MLITEELLEVRDHTTEGYKPVVDFDAWRVAVLNYSPSLRAENITSMQRHNETDEVFVLLRGHCLLFLGQGDATVTQVFAEDMVPLKIYTVKSCLAHPYTERGCYGAGRREQGHDLRQLALLPID